MMRNFCTQVIFITWYYLDIASQIRPYKKNTANPIPPSIIPYHYYYLTVGIEGIVGIGYSSEIRLCTRHHFGYRIAMAREGVEEVVGKFHVPFDGAWSNTGVQVVIPKSLGVDTQMELAAARMAPGAFQGRSPLLLVWMEDSVKGMEEAFAVAHVQTEKLQKHSEMIAAFG